MTRTDDAPPVTWSPTKYSYETSRLARFMRWLQKRHALDFSNYREIHAWSVKEPSIFWDSVREYFSIVGNGFEGALHEKRVLIDNGMPNVEWYRGVTLNFAENALRHAENPYMAETPAIVTIREDNSTTELTWHELQSQVASLTESLRRIGVGKGTCVVASLPNAPQTIVCMLAVASLGAIWSVTSPELSPQATIDRFYQLEPSVLIVCDGYQYNGKHISQHGQVTKILDGLPTVRDTVTIRLGEGGDYHIGHDYANMLEVDAAPSYEHVPFDHPLWVLYSSGTTGNPKGIVHSHGGIALEAVKLVALQQDLGPGDRYYVAANTSWVVWNLLVNNLLAGTTVVTYSGSPVTPRADRQFEIVSRTQATALGTGAAYLHLVQSRGFTPIDDWDLTSLKFILSTGSPLSPETWRWFHHAVSPTAHLSSDSGGTDVCSVFIGANPLEPVRLGELQGPALGVAAESWDGNGKRVVDKVGELVIRNPMPSMPVRFWGDAQGGLYRAAYFGVWSNVWRHGDWVTETARGSFIVHGRSDATLNRQGVRLGTADIYAALEGVPELDDFLVIGVEQDGGGYWMPLFVAMRKGGVLDDALKLRITDTIRQRCSSRHIPDEIIEVPEIPKTHSAKRLEVPLKRLFSNLSNAQELNFNAAANPEALEWFVAYAQELRRPK